MRHKMLFVKGIIYFCLISICRSESLNIVIDRHLDSIYNKEARTKKKISNNFQAVNWCLYNCILGGVHIGCAYKGQCRPDLPCEFVYFDHEKVVQVHNDLRNNFALGKESRANNIQVANMRALEWEEELAFVAGCNLKKCQSTAHEDRCRKTRRFPLVGQIVATGVGVEDCAKHTYDVIIKEWYEEIYNVPDDLWVIWEEQYEWEDLTESFSQLIWADTAYVGCALSYFMINATRTCLLVCNYGPSGNLFGKPVFRIGTPTSACPPGVRASKIYRGLCGNASTRNASVILIFTFYMIVMYI